MPYFAKREQSAYYCPNCEAWFLPSNVSCCVLHSPGSCCHYGEMRVEKGTGMTFSLDVRTETDEEQARRRDR